MKKSSVSKPNPAQFQKKRRGSDKKSITACQTVGKKFDQASLEEIYDSLAKRLEDSGSVLGAKYFRQLVAFEEALLKKDFRMKKRVRDSYSLLLAVVENVKLAEETYRESGNEEVALRLLTQTIYMIQAQDEAYVWLVKEFYKILFKLCGKFTREGCEEMLSRAYYEYGLVLAETDEGLEEAIWNMEKSLETCKGANWYTNDRDRNFLEEDVCEKLCETLLRIAALKSKQNSKLSAEFAERASKAIYGVATKLSPSMFCTAKIRQAEYLVGNQNYVEAFNVLQSIQNNVMSIDHPRNKCEFLLWLGICHFNITPDDPKRAIRKFDYSHKLSDQENFSDLEAQTLLYLGKIYSKRNNTHVQARECFIEAKELFRSLKDYENEKLARLLMAQLRAYQIFPNYLELIKGVSTTTFCCWYHLIQWKQRLLPFWTEKGELLNHPDGFQCILEEKFEE